MPKLSEQTIKKRFPCPHCGETFRTRQGLSGHIQFKHHAGTTEETGSPAEWFLDIAMYKKVLQSGEFSTEEVSELTQILADWGYIKLLIGLAPGLENTKVGGADFKAYLIMAYAQMLANRRLKGRLK